MINLEIDYYNRKISSKNSKKINPVKIKVKAIENISEMKFNKFLMLKEKGDNLDIYA